MRQNYLYYKAINWNDIEDELDNAVWEKLTSLFWLDTRIHIEEDKEQWESLSNVEQEQLNRLLVLLTNLATYQSMEAGEIIRQSERSQQEIAIINNLQFTEMVNTKAYNRILQVFNDNKNLQEWFDWVDNDEQVLNYLQEIDTIYQSTAATRKRFMSLCVEGLMNIAYLSYPIQLSIEKSFINMGQMLDMVIQNEAVHCYYLNHKVKLLLREMSQKEVSVFREWAVQTVDKLTRIAIQMIIKYYQDERSPEIAINLVKQEANHILASVELEDIYQVDSEKIAIINAKLNRLRQLNLQNSGAKVSNVMIDSMTEEDYDF
ncbi:ribonucleotide-diphosphate reductase subunit beta [Streptococcus hyointestinalis]|uniref:ribonucleotide-diphosphate reductase subunit beta n=1 Tax=Streptococcus hyointestinalis TaxID=1337 RepID=UPI003CFE1C15